MAWTKLMRRQSLLKLVSALVLSATLANAAPPAPTLASCAAPITPGAWSGPISRTVTAQATDSRDRIHPKMTRLAETVTANLALQVACDGTLTGSLSNQALNLAITVTVTNTISNKSTTINSTCTGVGAAVVTGGSVGLGAGGLPVFTLNMTVTWDGFSCSDPKLQQDYNQSGGSGGYNATLTLTASSVGASSISGAVWKTSDPKPEAALTRLATLFGSVTTVDSWQLNGPPGATATPEPDAPVITSLTPLYEKYFLLGVHTVLNQYTAIVDWKNGTPGNVVFTLGADAPVEIPTAPYAITKDMGDLPGSTMLEAVATNGEGKSSAAYQIGIDIVPIPAWAQRLSFAVLLKNGYVVYQTQQAIPALPFTKGYITVPDAVPFFGGPYGFTTFQLNANLIVDSSGNQAQDKVTGLGGAAWGKDKQVDLTIGGDTFTTLSPTQLTFDRGAAQMSFPPATYRKYFGLLDLIPGATALYNIRFVGRIIQEISELASIGVDVSATLGGQGNLGIKNDQVDATSGRLTLGAQIILNLIRLGFDFASVAVGGSGRGNVAVRFTPDWGLEACSVSLFFRA